MAYGGGGGETDYLLLLRPHASGIEPVLFTLMGSSALIAGEWHRDGTRDHQDETPAQAIIEVTQQKTNGYFDLLKKAGKAQARYRWNGSAYVTTDREPVEDVNAQTDDR